MSSLKTQWDGVRHALTTLRFLDMYNGFTWNLLNRLHTTQDKTSVLANLDLNYETLKYMLVSVLDLGLVNIVDIRELTFSINRQMLANYRSMKYPINIFAIFEHSLQRILYKGSEAQLAIIKAPTEKSKPLLNFLYLLLEEYFLILQKPKSIN